MDSLYKINDLIFLNIIHFTLKIEIKKLENNKFVILY